MIVIDLFAKNMGLSYLKEIYHLSDEVIIDILKECYNHEGIVPELKEDYFSILLKMSGIHPDTYDLSDVEFHCQHITTSLDEGKSIRQMGLKTANFLLENESLLHIFLKENGIVVSPAEHFMEVGDKRFYMPEDSSECENNYWDDVGSLCSTLYHDHGEVEAFICADEESMINYSTVGKCPEILATIGNVIENLTGAKTGLCDKWESKHPKLMKVEFNAALNEMSYIGGMGDMRNNYVDYIGAEEYCQREYFEENVPQLFWWNEWLVRNCLYNFINSMPEMCVGIKAEAALSPDRVDVKPV